MQTNRFIAFTFACSLFASSSSAQNLIDFSAGTPARAADVNKNFRTVFDLANDALGAFGIVGNEATRFKFVGQNGGAEVVLFDFQPGGGEQLVGAFVGNDAGPQLRFAAQEESQPFVDIGLNADSTFIIEVTVDDPRFAVAQNGNVGIGTVDPEFQLDVEGDVAVRTNDRILFGGIAENTDTVFFQRENTSTNVTELRLVLGDDSGTSSAMDFFSLSTSGNSGGGAPFTDRVLFRSDGGAFKPGGGSWGVLSDARSKRDIEPLEGALDKLLALEGRTYHYDDPNAVGAAPGPQIGFVAQEAEQVFPQWVSETHDGTKMLTISGFEALTVEALRELESKNAALESENDDLRSRLDSLESLVAQLAADRDPVAGETR